MDELREKWDELVPCMSPDDWVRLHREHSCAAAYHYAQAYAQHTYDPMKFKEEALRTMLESLKFVASHGGHT